MTGPLSRANARVTLTTSEFAAPMTCMRKQRPPGSSRRPLPGSFTQHKASETWQLIGAAWNRTEEIRVRWLAGQLAKILYVPGRSGALAKSEQILLGVKLALSYPKSEILQMYSSVAYFGHGYYGLQAASCGYFAVAPAALNWPQAALLAGLAQASTADDPLTHLSLARAREAHMLGRLAAMGKLTQAQAGAAYQQPLHLSDGHTSRCAARSAAK